MCGVNEEVETIIIHKANLIKNSDGNKKHAKSVLTEHGIISSETSEEEVAVLVKVFKMGAVDAMTFDVAGALDFPNWKTFEKRREILRKKFLEE